MNLPEDIPCTPIYNMPKTQNIDGKLLAEQLRLEARREIIENQLDPQLAVVLVGDDEPSQIYVRLKEKAAREVGITVHKYLIDGETKKEHLLEMINFLNQDDHIDAILIQLPLPSQLNENEIVSAITPEKDADGFHPKNLIKYQEGHPEIIPGLSLGILKLLEATGQNLQGKKAVIISNSPIFAQPLTLTLAEKNITSEPFAPDDIRLNMALKQADIVIVAIGRPGFITGDMIKTRAILIDVGITKVDGEIQGDVNKESINGVASFVTPVPGGVGPVTIAMLLKSVVAIHQKRKTAA